MKQRSVTLRVGKSSLSEVLKVKYFGARQCFPQSLLLLFANPIVFVSPNSHSNITLPCFILICVHPFLKLRAQTNRDVVASLIGRLEVPRLKFLSQR